MSRGFEAQTNLNFRYFFSSIAHKLSSYVCYICGKTFHGSKTSYECHMKRHNDIRDYECQQCSRKYVSPRELERHLTTHSDVRPFKCTHDGCGMAFKSKDVCRKHMKRHARKSEKMN